VPLDYMADLCSVFSRSFHIVFQGGCTCLHSQQQCMRVPFSLHPCQHLLLVVLLMIAILTGVTWNLSVVLICISFMARDGEQIFMCILAIWTSSFKTLLFAHYRRANIVIFHWQRPLWKGD
jgi:hypothetical protein